jgi:Pycsar effector protein
MLMVNKDSPMAEEIQRKSSEKELLEDEQTQGDEAKSFAADMSDDTPRTEELPATIIKKKKKPKKEKNKTRRKSDLQPGTSRGIETMFRVTFQSHIELTALADNKANTLININGIIISLVIALVSPRIETNSWMMVPALILTIGCMISLGYAIFASRPRILASHIDKEMVLRNEAEILFFGNFVNMNVAEFQDTMNELLTNRNLLYDNLTRNLYFMGKVLERKYRLLKYSYTFFFMTLAMAVVFFIGMFIGMAGE